MDKRELIEKLRRVDEGAFFACPVPERRRSEVVIVGGAALLLCDLTPRSITKDVDILQMNADDMTRAALGADPDFNGGCNAYSGNIPYNFEDRLKRVALDTLMVDYYVPSQEDLTVMKLYRWEDPDIVDLTNEAFLATLDWKLLERLVNDPKEAAASRATEPDKDRALKQMRHNYKQYKERCGR